MRVIGTAGHVDHGKSTLVQALTGVHPDRLKEEQQREMTIDLGFAWFTMPDGDQVGIVDVPGHRDFIENMLAGVGGMDAILFVIAADEGIMPQTREHLAIIDLLHVSAGLIVLTKIDLVEDEEWLLLEEEIRSAVKGTILQEAEIVRVSAVSGAGIDSLKQALADLLHTVPVRKNTGKPRLPIDRVFSIAGFGTVVTGTLLDGILGVGDEVVILPGDKKARIRGLQNHKQKVQTSNPGSRTAVNLSGVDVSEVRRGDVLAHTGDYLPTNRWDARIELLRDAEAGLTHNMEVKIFSGTSESTGRIRSLEARELHSGETGLVQVETLEPLILATGDRFILRRPSPALTLGGGVVLDAHPTRRYRMMDTMALDRLHMIEAAAAHPELNDPLVMIGFTSIEKLTADLKTAKTDIVTNAARMIGTGELIHLSSGEVTEKSQLISAQKWHELQQKMQAAVQEYHQNNPLRKGIPREELRGQLKLTPAEFALSLSRWIIQDSLRVDGNQIYLPGYQITFTPVQQSNVDMLLRKFETAPFSPPSVEECRQAVGDNILGALIEQGALVKVSQDIIFDRSAIKSMNGFVRQKAESAEPFTVAEFRDRFQTSRKYSLAYLEALDSAGITKREGDGRVVLHPEKLQPD